MADNLKWVELRLKPDRHPSEVYEVIDTRRTHHHFWDEPWWPGAYVVRLHGEAPQHEAIDHWEPWDETPDAEHYGRGFGPAMRFFQAGSDMASIEHRPSQLIHCYLNAQGFSRWQEVRWAVAYAWRSAWLPLRWRLYLRRRWEREQDR